MQPSSIPPSPDLFVPRWVAIALNEIGVVEDTRPGKSFKRIEQYHAATRGGRAYDDVAWCSSFCCWVFEQAGIGSPRSKAAVSWMTWGEASMPRLGAVAVFPKTDPDAKGTGHVAITLGVSGRDVYVLGGNQQNKVSIAVRKKADVLSYRFPASVQLTA